MQENREQITELIELNEELENYFRNTIIPQLFVDAALILRKFTPPAMKQFNLQKSHIGRPISEVVDNFRFPTIIENITQVINSGDILEKEVQTTDMNWYQMNIIPYVVRKGKKTNGVIITLVDITARIKDLKEQETLIAEHELLLDTIAHDIKNPLMALGLTIEFFKKAPEKGFERFPVLLQNVESSLKELKRIVYDLVETRWDEFRYKAIEEQLDLENILEDVRLTLAPQIQESKATIQTVVGPSQIFFPRRKLRSIIYNLVNNALKYRAPDRPLVIKIATYLDAGFLVISMEDNGIGIPQEHQRSIFNKYHRLENSAEGSGVGLYLVNQILRSSGGKITLESEVGKGSTFKVYLKHNG